MFMNKIKLEITSNYRLSLQLKSKISMRLELTVPNFEIQKNFKSHKTSNVLSVPNLEVET